MSKKTTLKPLAAALGTTFVVSLSASPVINAAENPFGMNAFESGYMVAEGNCGDKMKDQGKNGEGNCGENKDTSAEGKCGEGKCGEKRKANEGKCGEGKCGDKKMDEGTKMEEGKCGDKKMDEGKCGGNK